MGMSPTSRAQVIEQVALIKEEETESIAPMEAEINDKMFATGEYGTNSHYYPQ